MKRFIATALCGLFAMLALALPATAATFTDTAKLPRDTTVAVGQPLETSFDVETTFTSISQVCFRFAFKTDLLDPGDSLRIFLIEEGVEVDIGGFFNPAGQKPQARRWFCFTPEFHPDTIAFFLDGTAQVKIVMESGSVTLARLRLSIKGVSE